MRIVRKPGPVRGVEIWKAGRAISWRPRELDSFIRAKLGCAKKNLPGQSQLGRESVRAEGLGGESWENGSDGLTGVPEEPADFRIHPSRHDIASRPRHKRIQYCHLSQFRPLTN